jgi:hypothetical protein
MNFGDPMKILFSILLFLQSAGALAASHLGNEIRFYSNEGHPGFSIQTAVNLLMMTFNVNGYDLAKTDAVTQVTVQFLNKAHGDALSQPVPLRSFPNGVVLNGAQSFSFSLERLEAASTRSRMSTTALVISTTTLDGILHTSYFDMGAYCVSAPTQFMDLDTGVEGCAK